MPLDVRIAGLGSHLPGPPITSAELADALGEPAGELERRTGISVRHHASAGLGPSDLALEAAREALARAHTDTSDLGLIVFATATPDVSFPGAACYLQDKLGAPTIGALDVRAQSVGFLCGLELARAFAGQTAPGGDGRDGRYVRVLVAAGEVLSSGLDFSPRGRELTPRLADGAAAAVIGPAEAGLRIGAIRWQTDGTLVDRFWCEFPASRHHPHRIVAEDLAEGRHYPRVDLEGLAPIVRERLVRSVRDVLEDMSWRSADVDTFLIDYADPELARRIAAEIGVEAARTTVPTALFGHVMAAGLPIALERLASERGIGRRVLLAAAGPGLSWGAAALEA
jgi:3-oxoacyl-[acyl-carrier-protein] synthase III